MPLPKPYDASTTNGITDILVDFLVFNGCADAKRTNNTGTPRKQKDGSFKLVKSAAGKGIQDVDGTHPVRPGVGQAIKIEVKNKKTGDELSFEQWKVYQKVIKSNGIYLVAADVESIICDWWPRYIYAIQEGTFPLDLAGHPLQPVYERPGGNVDLLPTLDEWRRATPKKAAAPAPPATGDIIRAWMAPAPSFVKHEGDNRHSDAELQHTMQALRAQGFKVAFRQCLYYVTKPEEKLLKRLPKGYTVVSTPFETLDGMEFRDLITDKSGAEALDVEAVYEDMPVMQCERPSAVKPATKRVVTGYRRRVEMQEKFCIPEFIISENNGAPAGPDGKPSTVYVIDWKQNTNDFKIIHYVKVLKFILAAKGDKRNVRGGVINAPGGMHKNFTI